MLPTVTLAISTLRDWSARRWLVAVASGLLIGFAVALPTAVIPNPIFGRAVAVTWWSYPVVLITAVLGGLLTATYVNDTHATEATEADEDLDRSSRLGVAGALLSFFAVGCPVCNKLVLLTLGATGAITWFAPVQPFLALVSIVLMVVALQVRLRNATTCRITVTQ